MLAEMRLDERQHAGVGAPVLRAQAVVKTFREGREDVEVLRGVDLELRPGEIVALEGPSGSGKTTFLSILGCILTPTAGRVTVAGEEIDAARPHRLPRDPQALDRLRLPAVQLVPGAVGDRERRIRAPRQGPARPRRAARRPSG